MPKRNDRRLIVPLLALLVIGAAFALAHTAAVRAQSVNVSATVPGICGNGIIEPGEECDGADLNGLACGNLGFATGTLACSAGCSFDTSACSGSAGGGGGGSSAPPDTTVVISGWAYPRGAVVLLEGGAIRTSAPADLDAEFQVTLGAVPGLRTFTIYGVDRHGRRSPRHTFTVAASPNVLTSVTGIFLPPTLALEGSDPAQGGILNVLGQTVPHADVSVYVDLQTPAAATAAAGSGGSYRLPLRTDGLGYGEHTVHARASIPGGPSSGFSETLSFVVSAELEENLEDTEGSACGGAGDLSGDCEVDMADLSVFLFWWETDSPQGLAIADLNKDGRVDLVDLSILLFNWTE